MGTRTDAILAYGVETELTGGWDDSDDWLLSLLGDIPDDPDEYRTAVEALPVEVVEHCSDEEPMYLLAVRGTGRPR